MTAPTIDDHPPAPAGDRPPRRWYRSPSVALAAALVVVAVAAAGPVLAWFRPHLYAGTVLQGNRPAPPLDGLVLASGEPVDVSAHEGDVLLVFFGYTNCPDVCPLTLSTAARAIEQLDTDRRERVDLVMISVDPERDDLASLQRYVEQFDGRFSGAGGPTEAIDLAATRYGVYYRAGWGDDYLVDHTATLLGVGPDGALRVIWSPDVAAADLAADLDELLS